jgi:hypothetical protein
VAWVVPAYPQSEIFWHQFIVPTFSRVGTVRGDNRTVDLGTGGRLWVKSAEAIGTIRGLGENIGGVMFEEAAQYPTLEAFRREIRPILMDRKGWGAWVSSTKAGSEFNQICEEVLNGARSTEKGWAHWHNTPFDNPLLDPREIRDLIDEYPTDSEALKEEVYAELLTGGAGLAFPNWDASVHCVPEIHVPQNWMWLAGMDWGITAPSVLLLAAVSPQKKCLVAWEWVWRDKDAYEAGYDVGTAFLLGDMPGWPVNIWADSAMAAKTGIGGATVLMEFQSGLGDALRNANAPSLPVLPAPKGPGSRVAGYNSVRKMLDWGPRLADGTLPSTRQPQLKIVKSRCPYLTKVLPVIRLDEKKQDQIDTKSPDDHPIDALRYLLAGAWPDVPEPRRVIPHDVHPGYLPNGKRRSRDRTPEVELQEALVVSEHEWKQNGWSRGGSYGPRAT